ncbi:MAG: tripartite tricarboxylate transporter substrate binding protein [Betaproteobacteria bacterium]|nr:MAG: tripartite tricarboxylate transporter substrate binding protein [Betaproteobacteria bacterium]
MHRYAVMPLVLIGIGAPCALAQNYPTHVIRLVVPSSPGAGSDFLARLLAQRLGEALGQQVVVENRPGASGIIGVDMVAKSAPDGYTLVLTQTSLAINPSMFKKLPYDALRDLAPIAEIATTGSVLTLHPSVPAKTVTALIALAKAKPGHLVIGSAGLGTQPHLSAELFKIMAGVDMPQVLYKGSGPAVISLLAGEISLQFPNPPTVVAYIKVGRLRAPGVTTSTRIQALPEVPPIAETLPGYEAAQFFGILARAGTPRPIIERLNQEINRALGTPELKERMSADGLTAGGGTPDEFAARIKAETEKWAQVIKTSGIKPE